MVKLLIILASLMLARGQNISTSESITRLSTTPEPATSTPVSAIDNVDSIVKFQVELDDRKFPKLIVSRINAGKVPTKDMVHLYKLEDLRLDSIYLLISQLGFEPSQVLSIDGLGSALEKLNISFNTFYHDILETRMKSELDDPFFIALNVNQMELFYALGKNRNNEAWNAFKMGNFSEPSLKNALDTINKTVDDLFEACKSMFLERIMTFDSEGALNILQSYGFGEKNLLQLWSLRNITNEEILQTESARLYLNDISRSLSNVNALGVIIDSKHIATNKASLDLLEGRLDIAKIKATTLNTSASIKTSTNDSSSFDNIILITYESEVDLPNVNYSSAIGQVLDCEYLTVLNGSVYRETVNSIEVNQNLIEINSTINENEFIVGSPLLCDGRVYGIAKKLELGSILLDTFYRNIITSTYNTSSSLPTTASSISSTTLSKASTLNRSFYLIAISMFISIKNIYTLFSHV